MGNAEYMGSRLWDTVREAQTIIHLLLPRPQPAADQ